MLGIVSAVFFMLIADNEQIQIAPVRPLRLPRLRQDWQVFNTTLFAKLVSTVTFGMLHIHPKVVEVFAYLTLFLNTARRKRTDTYHRCRFRRVG